MYADVDFFGTSRRDSYEEYYVQHGFNISLSPEYLSSPWSLATSLGKSGYYSHERFVRKQAINESAGIFMDGTVGLRIAGRKL